MIVPVADPGAENALIADELREATSRVIDRGVYVLGPEVTAFERAFADFVGGSFAVGVASGTDALTLALRAFEIGPGDEVITVSLTAGATAAAILRSGATPVLVDVDRETLTLAPEALEPALTSRTRAIVPVHIYGRAADLTGIWELARDHGLVVIEDCAQGHGTYFHGSHVGSGSGAGAFSFYPTKNLGALGDGGAVVTSRAEVAEKVTSLRQYGWSTPQVSEELGWNSRLDELQAALLRVKLSHLDRLLEGRRGAASAYFAGITGDGIILPSSGDHDQHSFHLYVVRTPHREALAAHLRERGVGTAIHYPIPVHRQPAYANACRAGDMRETERATSQILSLPMFSTISEEAIEHVVDAINCFRIPTSQNSQ